jgi:hypothetical protein
MKTLREQMDDAMLLRGFASRTRESYLAAVKALAKYYHPSPNLLTPEDIQAYLLHLIVDLKLAYASVNQAACTCRILFGTVLRQPQSRFDIPMAKVPKSLPRVLSRDEVSRLFAMTSSFYACTLLMTPPMPLREIALVLGAKVAFIPCVIASPPICWNLVWISIPFSACWVMAMYPPPCAIRRPEEGLTSDSQLPNTPTRRTCRML